MRQNTTLSTRQSQRVAVNGALQAAIAQVGLGSYANTGGYPTCPTGGGTVTFTDPTVGVVTVRCAIKSLSYGGSPDGSANLHLGQDALILTDTTDANESLQFGSGSADNEWGWLSFSGNVRAKGNVGSIGMDAKSGKACLTYTTDPGTSCDQIIVSNGAVWASKTCASPGIFAAGGVNCNNTYSAGTLVSASGNGTTVTFTTAVAHLLSVGQKVTITGATPGAYNLTNVSVSSVPTATTFTVTNAASGTYVSGGVLTSTVDFGAQIDSILAKATTVGGELPFPATTGVVDRSALTGAVCTPASGKIPATMTLLPGYYGGDPTSTLNKATGGGYYVKSNKTACITTSAGADQIKDVLLSPGVYYFGLSKDWVVADGYSVVGGGTPLPLATDPAGTGTSYYYCDPTNAAGVQLVFGAASSGATVNGINNSGTVTLCGQANTAAAIALGGPNTVVLRGLRNPDFSPAVSLKLNAGSGPTLYADATCTQSTSATCGLLTNAATGAFNVTGFVFAPNDSFNLNLSPDCGTDTTWELLDCEANPTIGNGGIASFMGGVVLDGMYLNIVKNGGVNSASAAAKWQGVPWVPTTGLPNPSSGVNAADIVLTATGAGFSGSAEITVTQYAPGSNVFSNLKTIAWSNG